MSLLKNQLKCLSLLKLVWLICDTNDGRRTTAVLANRKNSKSLSIAPPNALPLKNHDLGSLCKKCGLRVSHVEKSSVFVLKKTFSATTLVVAFFSGNSKGDHLHAFTHHVFIFHLTFTSSACEHLFKRQASWFSFDTQSQKH